MTGKRVTGFERSERESLVPGHKLPSVDWPRPYKSEVHSPSLSIITVPQPADVGTARTFST